MVYAVRDPVWRFWDDLCVLITFVSDKFRYLFALRALRLCAK
jgi:hypothetical protein